MIAVVAVILKQGREKGKGISRMVRSSKRRKKKTDSYLNVMVSDLDNADLRHALLPCKEFLYHPNFAALKQELLIFECKDLGTQRGDN